jgi:hypothetical protein
MNVEQAGALRNESDSADAEINASGQQRATAHAVALLRFNLLLLLCCLCCAWPAAAAAPAKAWVDDDYPAASVNDGHTWRVDAFATNDTEATK